MQGGSLSAAWAPVAPWGSPGRGSLVCARREHMKPAEAVPIVISPIM